MTKIVSESALFLSALSQFLVCFSIENADAKFHSNMEEVDTLFKLFTLKFDPLRRNNKAFDALRELFSKQLENEEKENRQLFFLGIAFVEAVEKTNFFLPQKKAVSFRLDPHFLEKLPGAIRAKFPVIPFGIFFIFSEQFFGFHIRFQDLARGGLRTVVPRNQKEASQYAHKIFFECYELALTQQKKNKDIPEGGAKGIIFLKYEGCDFQDESLKPALYEAQKAFIISLLELVNCLEDGTLKAHDAIVDYYGKPEYLYLGPDEYMHDTMVEWIADYSKAVGYKPGVALITSKPIIGINHKQHGVTSLGVTCCLDAVLQYLGFQPREEVFTVKMAGGPDGDVAGNQMVNFYTYYQRTARLISVVDMSGVIHDPLGLDLSLCVDLFHQAKPMRFYPKEHLSAGGFYLDREEMGVLWVKEGDLLLKREITEHKAQKFLQSHLHQTVTDLFIPAGGRPGTLAEENIGDFFDSQGKPTSQAIIEGANVYVTPEARSILEEKGVIIIKDSSANKGGVICSSFEVLAGLVLSEEEFISHREVIVKQILDRIRECAFNEVLLILSTHSESGRHCSEISDILSERINRYAAEILDALQNVSLGEDHALMTPFFEYVLPCLRETFREKLIKNVPDQHKKAIIATRLASQFVYTQGIDAPFNFSLAVELSE